MNHSMSMTADNIRIALIQIAERMDRPPFDMIVVRDVINAFRYGVDHHLKDAVHEEKVVLSSREPTELELRLTKLKDVTSKYGMAGALAKASGVDVIKINKISCGDHDLNDATWHALEKGMQLLAQDTDKYTKFYKYKECGTYSSYKNKKCRCNDCVTAFKTYEAVLREKKRSNEQMNK